MMQKRNLRLLAPLLIVLAIFLSVPLTGAAAEGDGAARNTTGDATQGGTTTDPGAASSMEDIDLEHLTTVPVEIGPCQGRCPGHRIHGTYSGDAPIEAVIRVTGGSHDITLEDAKIDVANKNKICAFEIGRVKVSNDKFEDSNATVNLTISGINTLYSGESKAGLAVSPAATLNIKGTGKLDAKGGYGSAGIGGQGQSGGSGIININCAGGEVIATGGDAAAGIGGAIQGSAGRITIQNGIVNAKGGQGVVNYVGESGQDAITVEGGCGIGHGGSCRLIKNEVIISGGNVTAEGGYISGSQSAGIGSSTLSSEGNSVTISTNKISGATQSGNTWLFNGIVWNIGRIYAEIYGNAILQDDIRGGTSINVREGTSLSIPNTNLQNKGAIYGQGILLDVPNLAPGENSSVAIDTLDLRVTLIKEDIKLPEKALTYTGENLLQPGSDFPIHFEEEREVPEDSDEWYKVDTTGWELVVKKGTEVLKPEKSIINVGTYNIWYERKGYTPINAGEIKVEPRPLSEKMLAPIPDQIFNNKAIEPEVTVTYNNMVLQKGTNSRNGDYKVTFSNNTNVGKAKVTIDALSSNYSGKIEGSFNIVAESIANAEVTLDQEGPFVYDNMEHKPKVLEVLLPSGDSDDSDPDTPAKKKLVEGTDYKVDYSTQDFKSANDNIEITITGIGNYGGTITKTYQITPRPLTIVAVTAADRQYQAGVTEVDITGAEYDGLAAGDKAGDVIILTKGNVPSPEVNEDGYTSVTFGAYELGGNKGKNYTIAAPGVNESINLTKPVIISLADAPDTPKLDGTYSLSNSYLNKYVYTVKVTNPIAGTEYEYRMDGKDLPEDEGWQSEAEFDNIDPESTHTFEARSKKVPNITQSKKGSKEVTFTKLKNPQKPAPITLTFSKNRYGQTFTGTISSNERLDNVEYFIGKSDVIPKDSDYTPDGDVNKECDSNVEYTAYARYKETEVYGPSDPSTDTKKTEKLKVSAPVISPKESDRDFYDTKEVTITCSTKDAVIHYTTEDDAELTMESDIYDGEPIIVDKTTTVRAFAVKNNMEDSDEVSATFTKRLRDVKKPVITPKNGSEFTTKTQEVSISCETEDASIYYTIDGSDPDSDSESTIKYEGKPFEIDQTTTVKAIAVKRGEMNDSEIVTSTITRRLLDVETPVISPEDGTVFHTGDQEVEITSGTKGAIIYYTTDGSDPDPTAENVTRYKRPFKISETTIVKAIAVKEDMNNSEIVSAEIEKQLLDVKKPEIYPQDDIEFTGSKLVTITCDTDGAVIYYTTDGNDPTTESTKYRKPFRISTTTTIKAFAVKEDMNDSAIATVVINQTESSVKLHSTREVLVYDENGAVTNDGYITEPLREYMKTVDSKISDDAKVTEAIRALLTSELSIIGKPQDFVPNRINFYDLKLKIKIDKEPIRDARPDDFPEGGYTITIAYPEGTSMEENDFAVAHMSATGENAGDVEVWYGEQITKTRYGLQFNITGASPIAIASKPVDAENDETHNKTEGEENGNGTNTSGDASGDVNGGDGNGGGSGNGGTPSVEAPSDDTRVTEQVSPSTTAGGSNAAGTGTGSVADAVRSAAASLLPKTGDTSKIFVWVALAAACAAVIIGIQIKSKKENKKKKR